MSGQPIAENQARSLNIERLGDALDMHSSRFDDVPSDYYIILWSDLEAVAADYARLMADAAE